MKISTTHIFVEKSIKIHGDKYDYSKVVYKKAKLPVIIVCPIHGEFEQQPTHHLEGKGCYECGVIKRSDKKRTSFQDFVLKSKALNDNKYEYKEIFENRDLVAIICPVHGEFKQLKSNHLKGHGCKKCNFDKKRINDALDKFKQIHKGRYEYTKVKYFSLKQKVIITCKYHGDFEQAPQTHINGHGCPNCARNLKLTTEEFIRRSTIAHNNLYDYSKSEIKNSTTPVVIICKKHGEFTQIPTSHYLKNQGCPSCNLSKGENSIKLFLDTNNINYLPQYKFENCKNINHLPFDFYLLDLNMVIEFDGEQHFKVDGFINKTKEDLEVRKKCDKIKTDFCKKNKIKLLRINYRNYEKIDVILKKEII